MARDKKLFIGTKLRRLRRQLGLTQAQMAEDLAISPSYLTLLERNQRPLSASLLLRLAETFQVDVKDFSGDEESRLAVSLREVLADPLFEGLSLGAGELSDLIGASPATANALLVLYNAYRENMTTLAGIVERVENSQSLGKPLESFHFPIDEVRDFFQEYNNHFPELENAAEVLWKDGGFDQYRLYENLRDHLKAAHDITVRIVPADFLPEAIWRLDRHSRRLFVSEAMDGASRTFTLAHQIGLLGHRERIEEIVAGAHHGSADAAQLCRLGLANYFAGAVLMPYERFVDAADKLRYDIHLLGARFGATYEQVCHRLTSLHRPGAHGVPLFFVRVDPAGNVSKRFSVGGFHFARFGGVCPRWDIHRAFARPGEILTQIVEADAGRYFTFFATTGAHGYAHGQPQQRQVIALGCRIEQAHKIVYSDGHDLGEPATVTPIGVNCRLCERSNCSSRAHPPLNRPISFSEHQRSLSPYSFEGW